MHQRVVAVDLGHAVEAPVCGVSFDQLVDLRRAIVGHAKNVVGKALNFPLHIAVTFPESAAHLIHRLLAHICLEKHLQCQLARFAASTHLTVSHPQLSVYRIANSARSSAGN